MTWVNETTVLGSNGRGTRPASLSGLADPATVAEPQLPSDLVLVELPVAMDAKLEAHIDA